MIPSRTRCVRTAIPATAIHGSVAGSEGILLASDVVPHEDAVPAGRLRLGGELDEQPRVGVLAHVGQADRKPQHHAIMPRGPAPLPLAHDPR